MDTRVRVQYLGGVAGGTNLTGSCILLSIEMGKQRTKILVDVGLIQTRFRDSIERNLEIFDYIKTEEVKRIDAIIQTHDHIDHSGRIPLLVKNGFAGSIYCTEQSANLLRIMLEDNVKIQLSEARFRIKKMLKRANDDKGHSPDRCWGGNYDRKKRKAKGEKRGEGGIAVLYRMEDVEKTMALVKNGGYPYHRWVKIAKGVDLKFYPSGHVLGGAICVIRIGERNGFRYLGFSGDLGREDGVILPPPEIPKEPLNHWFTESTYGGKRHPARDDEIEKLLELVRKAVKEGKKIIIPSFALERTQEIIFLLLKNIDQCKIPKIPIFLDSPMATKITGVFSESWRSPGLFKGQDELFFNPFCPEENQLLKVVTSQEESSSLIKENGPHIVISGSGMCDAGRIRGYLREWLGSEKAVICLIGYMAEGSLGRKLKDRLPIVRMNGEEILIKADIQIFDSFSAHADSPFLTSFAEKIVKNNPGVLKGIFIGHGERKSGLDLKVELMERLGMSAENIRIPSLGECFLLT